MWSAEEEFHNDLDGRRILEEALTVASDAERRRVYLSASRCEKLGEVTV
jgi:hypothetical protein